MENNTTFSEQSARAILDLLVSMHSEIQVLKEQLGMIYSQGDAQRLAQVQKGTTERYKHHSQKLRDTLFEHYGELNIDDLLNH